MQQDEKNQNSDLKNQDNPDLNQNQESNLPSSEDLKAQKKEAQEQPSAEQILQEENARLKDQLLRQMAEGENLKKRTQREKEEARQYAITNFARDLLSVADNLQRALQALTCMEEEFSKAQKNFIEGVRLTERELESIFTRQGIKKVSPLGEKFDHNFHQAMFETESDDQVPGTVTQVLQEGYILQERLLRPAMVGVAKVKAS